MKKSNQGFTLIELIIVIVILGILAVTAAPKFLDLTGDARASTVQALQGTIRGASSIVNAKFLVSGTSSVTGAPANSIDVNNNDVQGNANSFTDNVVVVNRFPSVVAEGLERAIEIEAGDYQIVRGATIIRFYPRGVTPATNSGDTFTGGSDCYVSYTQAANNTDRPDVDVVVSSCSN